MTINAFLKTCDYNFKSLELNNASTLKGKFYNDPFLLSDYIKNKKVVAVLYSFLNNHLIIYY